MDACEWCEGNKDCQEFEPTKGCRPGYICTRERGHQGNHVTCLPWRHNVAEWEPAKAEADET